MEELSRLAQLNVEIDFYAKEFWAENYNPKLLEKRQYFQYNIPKGICKISTLDSRISNQLTDYLRESIEGVKLAGYWVNKREMLSQYGYF